MHMLTFTEDAGVIAVAVNPLPPDDVAHGVEVVLRAFAAGMHRWRTTGFYDGVLGYGLADPDAALIWVADRHGHIERVETASGAPDGIDEAAIARGLIAMITAGPGLHTATTDGTTDA
jgi:hypothetical protein